MRSNAHFRFVDYPADGFDCAHSFKHAAIFSSHDSFSSELCCGH
jgi:hypothetical protein